MRHMTRLVAAALVVGLAMAGCATAKMTTIAPEKVQTGQYAQTFTAKDGKTLKYLFYVPEDYAKSRKPWPVVLFLHGAGERGDDLEKVKVHGPPRLAAQGKKLSFIGISPQCPERAWWTSEVDVLKALLDDIAAKYNVDENRVYLTGLSMGGFGTWALAIDQPTRFAAIAPICGKGDPAKVAVLKDVPTWVFHGAKDNVVPLKESQVMVDALRAAGGNPKFTIYPEAGHDSWTETYNSEEFWKWLLDQRRSKR